MNVFINGLHRNRIDRKDMKEDARAFLWCAFKTRVGRVHNDHPAIESQRVYSYPGKKMEPPSRMD